MPRISRGPKARLNLEMSEDVRTRLENLRERTDADSLAEVVRRALAVYDLLWSEREGNGTFFIKRADGETKEVLLT
jgi:hypothetical protein